MEHSSVTVGKVIDFCKNILGTDINASDISTAHRLKPGNASAKSPILVRFSRRIARDDVYQARTKLKEYNKNRTAEDRIYVNEDLVASTKKLLNAAREKVHDKHISGAWTKNCHILVKTTAGSTVTLASHAQLHALVIQSQLGSEPNF